MTRARRFFAALAEPNVRKKSRFFLFSWGVSLVSFYPTSRGREDAVCSPDKYDDREVEKPKVLSYFGFSNNPQTRLNSRVILNRFCFPMIAFSPFRVDIALSVPTNLQWALTARL